MLKSVGILAVICELGLTLRHGWQSGHNIGHGQYWNSCDWTEMQLLQARCQASAEMELLH